MTTLSDQFKKALVSAAAKVHAEVEGDFLKVKDIDANQAKWAVQFLYQQGVLKEGAVTGFTLVREEWEDMGHKESANVVRLLSPRASRPYDVEYHADARELRIAADVVDARMARRWLDTPAAREMLLAFIDDKEKSSKLSESFNALFSAGFSKDQKKRKKAVEGAWEAVRDAGLEEKLGHDQMQRSLRAIARSKGMNALI